MERNVFCSMIILFTVISCKHLVKSDLFTFVLISALALMLPFLKTLLPFMWYYGIYLFLGYAYFAGLCVVCGVSVCVCVLCFLLRCYCGDESCDQLAGASVIIEYLKNSRR